MMKMLQEAAGFAAVTNRLPQPQSLGLFLMQLRSHLTPTVLPRQRRSILIAGQGLADAPHPVRITHLRAGSAPPARP